MIFVTVGTQLAFDRMVGAVDAWAGKSGAAVFAQIGPTARHFANVKQSAFLQPEDFDRYFNEASLVVAHAGMGSILTALSYGKPIIIMPRKASLGEHRNEHQMATAKRFAAQAAVQVAWDEQELMEILSRMVKTSTHGSSVISAHAPEAFLNRLRQLIDD